MSIRSLSLLLLLLSTCWFPAAAETTEERTTRLQEAYDAVVDEADEELAGPLGVYRHEGSVYLELTPEDMGQGFLVFPSVAREIADGRLLGGMMWGPDDFVLEFRRDDDRVLAVARTVRFRADEGTPEAKMVASSYSESVLAVLEIEGEDAPEEEDEEDEEEDEVSEEDEEGLDDDQDEEEEADLPSHGHGR